MKAETSKTTRILAGYDPTHTTIYHPVRHDLTPVEKAEYGRLLARTIRHTIPQLASDHKAAIEPLEAKLRELDKDREYSLDKLDVPEGTADSAEAEAMANVLAEIESTEDQIKSLKLEYKVALDKASLDVSLWRHRIAIGYEMRAVNCEWWVNWSTGIKALVTVSSGETVFRKALSAEERQQSMIEELFPPEEKGGDDE